MQKLMQTAILFGVPNGASYSYINYKKPLSNLIDMQTRINVIKKKHCTNGIVILNTNLAELGLTI